MSLNKTKSGFLTAKEGRTTTGRDFVSLDNAPCLVVLQIFITGGTASVDVEISDDPAISPTLPTLFSPIRTITEADVPASGGGIPVRIALPAGIIATNVTAIGGGANVKVLHRILVLDNAPESVIDTFEEGDIRARKVILQADVNGNAISTTAKRATKRLYGPAQPGTSAGTIYTCPANKIAIVDKIHINNTTGTAATITISIGTNAAATQILSAKSIALNDYHQVEGPFTLTAAQFIQALQGTGSALTVSIDGKEEDA